MAAPAGPRRRVLILTERFWPEPNFITADVAERLARDAEVTVIAPHPSYPRGRFYEGAKWWRPVRSREFGCTVWRMPFFPDQSLSHFRRGVSYLSFAVVAAIAGPFLEPKPDVVWVYHGPFTTAIASLWFKLARGARLVITSVDLWPESLAGADVARPGLLMGVLAAYSRWINSFADHIICGTQGIAKRYAADGVSPERLSVVPVWIPGVGRMTSSTPAGTRHQSDVVYAGNLGPSQQLETLVRAAALLVREEPDARVHFYGSGMSERTLRSLAIELGATNVHFHGRVSPEEAFTRTAQAAVQVVSLRRSPAFRATVPSKLALCFAATTPLAYALEGDAADIMQRSGGGIPFDPDDPVSLVIVIRQLLELSERQREAMRLRLRSYYEEHFRQDQLLDKYAYIVLGERAAANCRAPVSVAIGGG